MRLLRTLFVAMLLSEYVEAQTVRTLIFTRTTGFRHDAIPAAVLALGDIATGEGIAFDHTEDASVFSEENLSRYDSVIFLLTTGEVLDERQREAFVDYLASGGGFAAIHSAADTLHSWTLYRDIVGARFVSHPAVQPATVRVEDAAHPSTRDLPESWLRTDEWYDFDRNPRGKVHVLASVQEGTYSGGTHGSDHPIAWCHELNRARVWYTAMGHTIESYSEPLFRQHVRGGLRWVSGLDAGDCRARNGAGNGALLIDGTRGEVTPVTSLQLTSLRPGETHRISGDLFPRFSEQYLITVEARGIVTLLVGGKTRLDRRVEGADSLSIDLAGGVKTPFVLSYLPDDSQATLRVSWMSASQINETIAAPQLYPPRRRLVRP